jgi:hypothetical protein
MNAKPASKAGFVVSQRRRDDAVGEQACAGKGMRATGRDAPYREPLDPERIDDRAYVRGAIRDRAARLSVGAAVTRAIVGEQTNPTALRVEEMRAVQDTRARSSGVNQHRVTLAPPALLDQQGPPVGSAHNAFNNIGTRLAAVHQRQSSQRDPAAAGPSGCTSPYEAAAFEQGGGLENSRRCATELRLQRGSARRMATSVTGKPNLATTRSSSTRTAFGLKCSAGPAERVLRE